MNTLSACHGIYSAMEYNLFKIGIACLKKLSLQCPSAASDAISIPPYLQEWTGFMIDIEYRYPK
jgi:hypothetical protein